METINQLETRLNNEELVSIKLNDEVVRIQQDDNNTYSALIDGRLYSFDSFFDLCRRLELFNNLNWRVITTKVIVSLYMSMTSVQTQL